MAAGEMSQVSLTKLLSLLGAKDIFEIITDAIAVAAHDHPHELEQRRESILQMLDAAKASDAAATAVDESALVGEKVDNGTKNHHAGDENGSASSDDALPVSERVARINSLLVAGEEDGRPSSDEAVLELLRALKAVRMTFEALEATKIGRTVSGLRKHASEQVRELAGDLYKGWKTLADEHFRSSRTSPTPTSTTGAATAANAKAKTAAPKPTPTSKPSGHNQETRPARRETPKVVELVRDLSPTSAGTPTKTKAATRQPKPSACERKEAPPIIIDEARLATAKRKLHEGYEEAATVKKQSRIQVISAPEKTRQRPVVRRHCVVRQHAAAVAGRRVPAPSSLRMCF